MSTQLARLLVFVASASVLVIEILAARLLAPYIGVSLEVFTGIIGVILAGISVGAWLGGRAADRMDPSRLLGPLFVLGGLSAMAAPLIMDAIGPSLVRSITSVVTAAAVGFFVPAAFLSAVPPVVVKIQLATLERTGSVVGSYSAVGTLGAIFGTFITGFFLIAAFPTRPIITVLGVALGVLGAGLSITRIRWALLALGASGLLAAALLAGDPPCQYETAYHCAVIEVDLFRESGRTLYLDRLPNSYVDIEDPTYLHFRYIKLIADVLETEAPAGSLNMVSIGGGGFTMPGYVEATRPGSQNIVLEIDDDLVEIGRSELGLDPNIDVIADDARISIRGLSAGAADVVVGDAFSGATVPWHLTTREFIVQIEEILTDDGVYIMNVIDYGGRHFVRSEAATLREVFDHVALFAPPGYIHGDGGGNYILVASDGPIDIEAIHGVIGGRGGTEIGITGVQLDRFIDGAAVLTDDFAPVDQLLLRR
ncbi:MAG: fused MFS/spermidine synthase [Acidimicrobiia bacterium]|nr:fused MFS/spermidine synthase [Acidimicrobiia bacterium]